MSVKRRKKEPKQITLSFDDIRIKIINEVLRDPNNSITGHMAVDRIMKFYDQNYLDNVINNTLCTLHIFSEDAEKMKDHCSIFEIIPGLSVKTESFRFVGTNSTDGVWYEVTFTICGTEILHANIVKNSQKLEAHRDNLYTHDFVHVSKFSNELYNPGVMFDLPPSANLLNSVLSDYQKGYISVLPPPPSNPFYSIRDRLVSNKNWYNCGWVTIHGILKKETYGEITIGTTMEEIKKLDPELYDKRFKDGKCPITLIDYSELKGFLVLTNTKIICEIEGFEKYITSPHFNGLCPSTKLRLK